MANLLSDYWIEEFDKNYAANFNNISKNLMVHLSTSPYDNYIKDERKKITNELNVQMDKAIEDLNNKLDKEILNDMRNKEKIQAYKLANFCLENLNHSATEMSFKENQQLYDGFVQNIENNFLVGIKFLNKLFFKYSTKKLSGVINEQGYYDYTNLFNEKTINELMKKSFEKFINIFEKNTDTNKAYGKIKTNYDTNIIKNNFNNFMNELLDKQREAENLGKWEMVGVYEAIIQYCSGRGITLLNYLKKEIGSFEKAQLEMINSTDNEQLQNIYIAARKQKVHTTIRKKNRKNVAEKSSIEGSFYGAITSPNKGGVILEYLDKGLFNNSQKLNFSNEKIRVEMTGKNLNVLGKSQKNDLVLSFSLKFDRRRRYDKKIISKDNNKYINTNPNQIGISIKNYNEGSDVTVHSAGNLNTITKFLKTYNPIGIDGFCKILEQPLTKYLLINDRNKNTEFYKVLKNTLGKQGAIFTLTPFLVKKGKQVLDESVDFFLIDQVLVPGSLIIESANQASQLATTKHKVSDTGFYVNINNNSDVNDYTIKKFNKNISKGLNLKSIEDLSERFPYNEKFVNKTNALGKKVFDKITFTVEMRNSFRKNLEKKVELLK